MLYENSTRRPRGHRLGGRWLCRFRAATATPAAIPRRPGPWPHRNSAVRPDELARLLAALADQSGFEAGTAGLVRTLKVQPGEVELQLTVGRHCGGAELANTTFQALRRLLPDTDIYVLNTC